MAKGKKFGRELVRSVPDALDGKVITGLITATSNNFQSHLNGAGAAPVRNPEPYIEGVVVKAAAANTGTVYILEAGGEIANGYPLAAGQTLAIHINQLSKVHICIAVSGEKANYVAIAESTE